MGGKLFIVKKWDEFQHYKRRNPPWIRLYRNLLDNYEFQCLPLASKALAPQIWLLASESKDGTFNGDSVWLAFRLRMNKSEIEEGLQPLVDHGFIADASNVLAECLQHAMPETETETETEAEAEFLASKGHLLVVDITTGEVAA